MAVTGRNGKTKSGRSVEKPFGAARKHRDAGKAGMRTAMYETSSLAQASRTTKPAALWLPLAVLDGASIYGRSRLQKTVFLAQCELGLDVYKFADRVYEPHSDELERDFMGVPELIAERLELDEVTEEYRLVYFLTELGRKKLADMEKGMDPGTIKKVRGGANGKTSTSQMLEMVYSRFGPELDGSAVHKDVILAEIRKITPPAVVIFDKFHTRESMLILAWMENMGKILARLDKARRPMQRIIIFNMSMSMIQRCKKIMDKISPPTDSGVIEPMLRGMDELERQLLEYCDLNGIMRDPYTIPLDEIIAGGDSKRLMRELSKIRLHAE